MSVTLNNKEYAYAKIYKKSKQYTNSLITISDEEAKELGLIESEEEPDKQAIHTITFKNGDEIVRTITGPMGTYVSVPGDLTKEGYVLDGWSLDGEHVTMPVDGIYDSDITYIAVWSKVESGEQIGEPVVIDGTYWYVGVNIPTIPYDPEANIATGDGLGWRKIEGDITSYNSKTNPIYDGITNDSINTENDSFEFYFGIPQGCVVADDFNDNANDNYMLVKTVSIGGITYNFYKAMGDSFNVYIYYNN